MEYESDSEEWESLAIKIEVKASVGGEVERFDRQQD